MPPLIVQEGVQSPYFVEVTKEELEEIALESTRAIEIDEFVDTVRREQEYFAEIQDFKVTKDTLNLAKHIVIQPCNPAFILAVSFEEAARGA